MTIFMVLYELCKFLISFIITAAYYVKDNFKYKTKTANFSKDRKKDKGNIDLKPQ